MEHIDDFFANFERSIDFESFLGIKFFLSFARFEYALKTSGFLENKSYASPDWNAYAESIEAQMNEKPSIQESLEYFVAHPTKSQDNINGRVQYVETPFENQCSTFTWAIRMIKRVRNNFFHGGKYRDLVVEDSLRNTTLLNHSLIVLNECLKIDNEVSRHFKNYQY